MDQIIDDLRIEAASPPRSLRPGTAQPVTLQFINLSSNPRTLFFIVSETFRFGQSTLRFKVRGGPTQVQPIARDGYVPNSSDFHTLPPRDRLIFTQNLNLGRTTPLGDLKVEWEYQNALDCWPSKMSNGGEPIPGIWRGRLTHSFLIRVVR
jgi:hypothetical protein